MDYDRIIALHAKLCKQVKLFETNFSSAPPPEVANELRYALRAEMEIREEELKEIPDQGRIDEAMARVHHALLCAYHDLFDGVVIDLANFFEEIIEDRLEAAIQVLGERRLGILSDLDEVTDFIAQSRENLKERSDIYDNKLYDEWFEKLLGHKKFLGRKAIEDILEIHLRNEKEKKLNRWAFKIGIAGFIIGIVGIAIALP